MSITGSQIQQIWARIFFAIAGLLYLHQHAVFFAQYQTLFLAAAGVYFIYNLFSLAAIKRRPLSAFRALFSPALDISIVSFAIIIDGGHASGLYFMLLVIVFGNSFRYGNALLLYTQALSTLGLIAIAIFTLFNMHLDLDRTLLIWQLLGLMVIPSYIYLIGEKAESAIRGQKEAEQASFSLLDQGPLPVFTYDLNSNNQPRVLYANAAINDVFRDDYTRLIGEQPDMLTLLEDGEEMLEFCRQALQPVQLPAKQKQFIYMRGRDQRDNILRLMCNATRLRWRNQWIGVCFILDITKREATQARLEAMHRQGYMSTLVAGIVHDFRNVLTTMIGYSEVLHMDEEDHLRKNQLHAIIEAGERGSDMISHLLTLGRTDNENIQPSTAGDQLVEPLENILGLARLQLPAHVQLNCKIDKPLPNVDCSILEIEQIMLNLAHNAAFSIANEGQIDVHIGAVPKHVLSQGDHPALMIEVRDTGCGIADENLNDIFKPFWTSRKHEGGSGLGLAMVQRIVKQRNGKIEVASQINKGTTFTIYLPPFMDQPTTDHIEGAKAVESGTPAKESLHADKPCKVLLVDDTPEVIKIHQALLERLNHVTSTASNGQEALETFQHAEQSFDLIITDYRMPVMDGLEFIKAIREADSSIPIIMITAFGEDEKLQEASNYDIHLVNKPITLNKLEQCIRKALTS